MEKLTSTKRMNAHAENQETYEEYQSPINGTVFLGRKSEKSMKQGLNKKPRRMFSTKETRKSMPVRMN